jgi:hypothetical protein
VPALSTWLTLVPCLIGAAPGSPRALFSILAAAMLAWFGGFAVLRIVTARRAAKAGRGEYVWLLTDIGWMWEKGRPWTSLARFTFVWLFGGPVLLVGGVALARWLGQ